MKKLLIALLVLPLMAVAAPVENTGMASTPRADKTLNAMIPAGATVVLRQQLGSGTPGFTGYELATHMGEGIYHAPQYMPTFPTAGTLWPRVIDVNCIRDAAGVFVCDGYEWLPAMGRGEYLYIRPVAKAAPAMMTVEKIVPVIVERKVFVEVPVKRKGE